MDGEEKILSVYRTNEREAFRLLYVTYFESLSLFARHIIQDSEAAADLVQDCFVDFWVNKRLNKLKGGLENYIFKSVKYAALTYLRDKNLHEQHNRKYNDELIKTASTDFELKADELEKLYKAIKQLPEKRREIFLSICLDGMRYQDVANVMDISINTVKTQMARAIAFLRKAL